MAADARGYSETLSRRYDSDLSAIFGGPDRGDLDYFAAAAAAADGPICEIGAGTGRVVLVAAEAAPGREVTGVEPSASMRAELTRRLAEAPPDVARRVRAVDGSFTHVPLPDASQALVYSAFRSFQHLLDGEDQLAGLREIRRLLRPGGVLTIDLFDPSYDLLTDAEPTLAVAYETPRGSVVRRYDARRLDRVRQCVEVTFHWLEEDLSSGAILADEASTYAVRYTFHWELIHLVARAGFEAIELFGDYDLSPVEQEPRELVLRARAPRR